MKRQLMAIRKVVTPQRDMFAGLSAGRHPAAGDDRRERPVLP